MPVFIGRVWSDGDPFLVLDAADAPAWSPSPDDYEALVEQLARQKTELAVGSGPAFVLAHEAGEIEVRTGELAFLRAAVPWSEANDEERFGIDVWRIA